MTAVQQEKAVELVHEGPWVYNGVEFKVGDKVQIFTTEVTAAPSAMGVDANGEFIAWDNSWQERMDYAIGGINEIEYITETGVHFVEYVDEITLHPHQGYGYPLSVLAKV